MSGICHPPHLTHIQINELPNKYTKCYPGKIVSAKGIDSWYLVELADLSHGISALRSTFQRPVAYPSS